MATKVLDLRKQSERRTFKGTTKDEIRYAEAFWQSVRLQPTMESRLVSSDIKQRLGKRAASSKSGASAEHCGSESDQKLSELFIRARTLDQIERFERLRYLAEARIQDRNRLHKRREERIRKEQISRDKLMKPVMFEDIAKEKAIINRRIGEAYSIEEMIREIDKFDKKKFEEQQGMEEKVENAASLARVRYKRVPCKMSE